MSRILDYIAAFPQAPAGCGHLPALQELRTRGALAESSRPALARSPLNFNPGGRARLALLALLVALAGCAKPPPEGTAQLALRWSFLDGRSCDTSGVSLVFVLVEGEDTAVSPCAAGVVALEEFPAGPRFVRLEGRSPSGGILYVGELEVSLSEGEAQELEVPLFFQGGP
jgi:hypothetical protein